MLEIPTESDLGSRDVSALLWTEIRFTTGCVDDVGCSIWMHLDLPPGPQDTIVANEGLGWDSRS